MNYSLPNFSVSKVDFLKGNATYDDLLDGGQTIASIGGNSFDRPGLLSISPVIGSTIDSGLPSNGIINYGFGKGSAPAVAVSVAVGANAAQDGYFYAVDYSSGATHTQVGSSDTAHNYTIEQSDTVFYQQNIYTTSQSDITKNDYSLSTRDTVFWSTTKGMGTFSSTGLNHHMVVFGDVLYITDGRYLHSLDGTTATAQVFDVGLGYFINTICVYDNQIYITAEQQSDTLNLVHGLGKMYTWDGYSASWLNEWDIEFKIPTLRVSSENILYAWTSNEMLYWDGSRFKPVRPMSRQIYKHQVTECLRSLFFTDNRNIIRYGSPVKGGGKRFFHSISITSQSFTAITSVQINALILTTTGSTNGSNYLISNINTPSTSATAPLIFNNRLFPVPVKVRHVVIELGQAISSGQSVTVSMNTDTNTVKTLDAFANATSGMAGKLRWKFDVFGMASSFLIQPRISITGAVYIRRVLFYYEFVPEEMNP